MKTTNFLFWYLEGKWAPYKVQHEMHLIKNKNSSLSNAENAPEVRIHTRVQSRFYVCGSHVNNVGRTSALGESGHMFSGPLPTHLSWLYTSQLKENPE